MKPSLRIIAILLPIAGASLAFAHLRSFSRADARSVDLTIPALRIDVQPDRRLAIALDLANRGADLSSPVLLFVHSAAVERSVQLAPLRAGEERAWSWLSPPLEPGDYELVASVQHQGDALDTDESNNLARALLHVPGAGEDAVGGPSARMPSVRGLGRRAATRVLRAAGFADVLWYERAKGSEIDRVDQQWPDPGTRLARAIPPVLVAAAEQKVPSLVGLGLDRARDQLRRDGFVPGRLRIDRSPGHTGRSVLGQEPAPGSHIAIASPVGLVVSDPRPLWPFVAGGLMGLIGLLLALTIRARGSRSLDSQVMRWSNGVFVEPFASSLRPRLASIGPAGRPSLEAIEVPISSAMDEEAIEHGGDVRSRVSWANPTLRGAWSVESSRSGPVVSSSPEFLRAAWPLVFPAVTERVPLGDVAREDPRASHRVATSTAPFASIHEIQPTIRKAVPELLARDAVPATREMAIAPRALPTIQEMEFVPIRGEGRQEVTWHSETKPTTLTFLVTRHPGDQAVIWHERSTT